MVYIRIPKKDWSLERNPEIVKLVTSSDVLTRRHYEKEVEPFLSNDISGRKCFVSKTEDNYGFFKRKRKFVLDFTDLSGVADYLFKGVNSLQIPIRDLQSLRIESARYPRKDPSDTRVHYGIAVQYYEKQTGTLFVERGIRFGVEKHNLRAELNAPEEKHPLWVVTQQLSDDAVSRVLEYKY